MDAQKDFTTVEWFEVIVIFNSLLRNIDFLRTALDSEKLSEDEQYNLEEELNGKRSINPNLFRLPFR